MWQSGSGSVCTVGLMVENEGAGLDDDCRKDSLDQRYIAVLGRPEPGLGVSVVSSPPSMCAYRNRFPATIWLSPERWCASRRLGRFLVNLKADSMCIVQLDAELTCVWTGCLVGV